jgi:hypothetical protein
MDLHVGLDALDLLLDNIMDEELDEIDLDLDNINNVFPEMPGYGFS